MKYYNEERDAVLSEVSSCPEGLSEKQAEERLLKNGKNALAAAAGKSLLQRFLEQLKDPMILILIAAAVVSGILAVVNNESFTDVIIIMAVVLINAVLGVYQENKAEKAIEALQKMSAATSNVMRDGKVITLKSEDLVRGDIVLLEAGDAVPADGRILDCASLRVEEAALTGESVPVIKLTDAIPERGDGAEVPLGDRKNMLYMGSTVVYGRGTMVVTATGMDTEMGKIAGALAQAEEGQTPLQRKMSQLSRILTWLVLGICAAVFAVHLFKEGKFAFKPIIDSFMVSVSLAVAAIPEGLAAVVTVVLSIGVTKMSKRNAIIRKLTAVETLGCAQIICSDKTGTLTQNKMTVTDYFGENEQLLATAMALCCDAELNEDDTVTGEPTEAALVAWADQLGLKKYNLKNVHPRVCEAPFDSLRKMMSTVHKDGDAFVQYTKGAPDMLLGRCTSMLRDGSVVPMTDEDRNFILEQNKAMADRALRVLACATRAWKEMPETDDAENLEHDLCFVGLCGMIDPVRPEVKDAIDRCRAAGIRPIMITGDHVDTAVAIAKELGILGDGQRAVTGAELGKMTDEEFENCYRDISVYARVQPEHKTRIVNMWQKDGSIVAMTGDGVNDAPSIKAADIGVGMGITGTDVTKNVADMVLADDNFATIVNAVEEGRRIYDNIRKAIQFLLGSNMSEVLAVFISSIMGFTLLKPVHLLWINLVTDCFPALALGMEKGERNVMRRKPRDAKAGIFAGGMGFDIAYQGVLVAALVFVSYVMGRKFGSAVSGMNAGEYGMTMAFITMSAAEIFHSINMRSQRESIFRLRSTNALLYVSAVVSLLVTTAVTMIPAIAGIFGFVGIKWSGYLIALGLGACVIPLVELVKCIQRVTGKKSARHHKRNH